MGSFTSTPKIIPSADADDYDAEYASSGSRETAPEVLERCRRNLATLPMPIERSWSEVNKLEKPVETFRVLQWNVLSQGEIDK